MGQTQIVDYYLVFKKKLCVIAICPQYKDDHARFTLVFLKPFSDQYCGSNLCRESTNKNDQF